MDYDRDRGYDPRRMTRREPPQMGREDDYRPGPDDYPTNYRDGPQVSAPRRDLSQ